MFPEACPEIIQHKQSKHIVQSTFTVREAEAPGDAELTFVVIFLNLYQFKG